MKEKVEAKRLKDRNIYAQVEQKKQMVTVNQMCKIYATNLINAITCQKCKSTMSIQAALRILAASKLVACML